MKTILFGNTQKFNVFTRRLIAGAVGVLFCFIGPLQAQSDWGSPLKECWKYLLADTSTNPIASDNEYIFIPTPKGSIISLDQRSGLVMWKADLGGNLGTEISVTGNRVFTSAHFGSTSEDANFSVVREVDPESGLPYWQVPDNRQNSKHLTAAFGSLLISYTSNGTIEKLGADGVADWKLELGAQLTTRLSAYPGYLIVGTGNRTLILIDQDSGELISQINIKGVPNAVAGRLEHLVAGDSEGNVYGFNGTRNRSIWMAKTGGGISGITIFDNNAIVTSKDNFVYSIDIESGKKNWKRKLAGRIFGLAKIDPVHAVFTTSGSTTAVILNLTDGRLVNKLDLEEEFVSAPVKIRGGFVIATASSVTAITNSTCGN